VGAPKTNDIGQAVETAWMYSSPKDEVSYRSFYHRGGFYDEIEEGGGKAINTQLLGLNVGQARWGRDPSGRSITYWSVTVSMGTKYRYVEGLIAAPDQKEYLTLRD
jgi:hypothetical protein